MLEHQPSIEGMSASDSTPGASLTKSEAATLEAINGGSSSLIFLRQDGAYVEKIPHSASKIHEIMVQDIECEYSAYARLPKHSRLLQLHPDSSPQRLVLPYLPQGCLHDYLRTQQVSCSLRIQFAADAAEGLDVLHQANIIHGDINSFNFLIDAGFRLLIIDFAGSSIDGVSGSGWEGVHYCLPRSSDSTVRSDIFALGCLLYEIETGDTPCNSYSNDEVEQMFSAARFPDVSGLPLGLSLIHI